MPFTTKYNNLVHRGPENLRDYEHAAYVFRPNQYANSPRRKFLFHVYFTLNTGEIPLLGNVFGNDGPVSVLVKNIELPSFKIKTDTMNQYNRKRIVQSKIEYDPIDVEFHDDSGDAVRKLWYYYYTYYYKDATHRYGNTTNQNGTNGASNNISNGFDYNDRDIYSPELLETDWGYSGQSYKDGRLFGSKPPFFRDIRVYGFDQSRFAEYVLINPIISQWRHDTYDYSEDAGIMNNRMTLEYETVKYYSGQLGKYGTDNVVDGFPSEFYDPGVSPLIDRNPEVIFSEIGGSVSDLQSGEFAIPVGAPQQPAADDLFNRPADSNTPALPPEPFGPVPVEEPAISTPLQQSRQPIGATPPGENRAAPNQTGNTGPFIP